MYFVILGFISESLFPPAQQSIAFGFSGSDLCSFISLVYRVVGRCRKCTKLDNDARLRHDFSQYRVMLKDLRRSEESFEDGSKVAYLLQV